MHVNSWQETVYFEAATLLKPVDVSRSLADGPLKSVCPFPTH